MKYTPHDYQLMASRHIIENPYCGLFLDMGLGKTVSTLSALNDLKFDLYEANRVLVIAPKRVAGHTWSAEIAKWDHLRHLTVSKILGSEKQRKMALNAKADIYVINRENVPWLVAQYGQSWPFDTVVIDELSSFKSPKATRFKALRSVRPFMRRVIGLTGTPAPNGLHDLWAQVYLLDQGARLEKTITAFRARYLVPEKMQGHIVHKYRAATGAQKIVEEKIADICISMRAVDHLDLPERVDIVEEIKLPLDISAKYANFERDAILQMAGEEITALNAAALVGKLLQYANGAVYDQNRATHSVHDLKLDALEELVDRANGDPVLVFYLFRHDVDRIKRRIPHARELGGPADIDAWNRGEIPVLLAHPASAGHGLNTQDGGHIIAWFGLPWSLELYQQAVARLHRQGQRRTVANYMLICPGTVEDDVKQALERKARGQDALLEALKARIDKVLKR